MDPAAGAFERSVIRPAFGGSKKAVSGRGGVASRDRRDMVLAEKSGFGDLGIASDRKPRIRACGGHKRRCFNRRTRKQAHFARGGNGRSKPPPRKLWQ